MTTNTQKIAEQLNTEWRPIPDLRDHMRALAPRMTDQGFQNVLTRLQNLKVAEVDDGKVRGTGVTLAPAKRKAKKKIKAATKASTPKQPDQSARYRELMGKPMAELIAYTLELEAKVTRIEEALR